MKQEDFEDKTGTGIKLYETVLGEAMDSIPVKRSEKKISNDKPIDIKKFGKGGDKYYFISEVSSNKPDTTILGYVYDDSPIWKENKAPEGIRNMKYVYTHDIGLLIVLANSDDKKFDQISIFAADKLKLICTLDKVSNIFKRKFTK